MRTGALRPGFIIKSPLTKRTPPGGKLGSDVVTYGLPTLATCTYLKAHLSGTRNRYLNEIDILAVMVSVAFGIGIEMASVLEVNIRGLIIDYNL